MHLRCWQPNSSGHVQQAAYSCTALLRRHNASQVAVAIHSKLQTPRIEQKDIFRAQTSHAACAGLARATASGRGSTAQQQQQEQQHVVHPVLQSCMHVQLLHQAALVNSWQAAEQLLWQHSSQLQQAHVGLLWWQLRLKLLQCKKHQARLRLQQQCFRQQGSATSLQPRLGRDEQCSAEQQLPRAHHHQQQQQQRVLQKLLDITVQHISNLSPQSLGYTMQGIAAAAAAGLVSVDAIAQPEQQQQQQQQQQQLIDATTETEELDGLSQAAIASSATVLQLPADLPALLWRRLMAVAATCTGPQLANCIAAGQHLGWQLSTASSSSTDTSTSSNSSSTATTSAAGTAGAAELCCWPVLQQAMSGVLGSSLRRRQHPQAHIHSREAGQLLHAVAGYVRQQRLQHWHGVAEQQQQQHGLAQQARWRPAFQQLVQRLADTACTMKFEQQAMHTTYAPGQGVRRSSSTSSSSRNHSGLLQAAEYDEATASTGTPTAHLNSAQSRSSTGSNNSSSQVVAPDSVSALVCSLQAAALLQVLPNPQQLEVQLQQLEPLLQDMPAAQLLQLLQALTDLKVEPWQSWLEICYSRLGADMHLLQPQQLLQLLQLLPHITRLQPDRQMLSGLAKLTAVHITRLSWRQLAVLPLGFAALGFRPEPYWLKDYVAASTTHLQRQQLLLHQHQQPGQLQLQVRLLVDMLHGVSWLTVAAATRPPSAWLAAVDQQLSTTLAALDRGSSTASSAAVHADKTAATKPAFKALQGGQQQASSLGSQISPAAATALPLGKLLNPASRQRHRSRQRQQRGQGAQRPSEAMSDAAVMVMAAYAQMQHNPSVQLQQLLGCGSCSTSSGVSSCGSSSGSSSSMHVSRTPTRRRHRQRNISASFISSSSSSSAGPPLQGVHPSGDQSSVLAQLDHSRVPVLQSAASKVPTASAEVHCRNLQQQKQQLEEGREQAAQLLVQAGHVPSSTRTVQLMRQLQGFRVVHRDVQPASQNSPSAAPLRGRYVDGRSSLCVALGAPVSGEHVQVDEAMLAAP